MHRTALRVFVLAIAALILCPSWTSAHPGSAIAVHPDGRVFFVDTGGGLFSIERNGKALRHEGPAFHWFALDAAGRFRQTPWPSIPGGELRAVGTAPTIILSSDAPVLVDDDAFYFPERSGEDRIRIVRVSPNGTRAVRAVLPIVRRGNSVITWLNALAAGPNDSIYYTEDSAVRKIDAQGRVTTVANVPSVPNCAAIPGGEPGVGPYLRGLAVADDGKVYVAAAGCGALLQISPRGEVSTLLRTASPWSPTAVALLNGEIYVLEYLHTASDDRFEWLPRIRKIQRDGTVVLLANTAWR
jgi:DNA-binding beta-propeller fold protein YncE